MKAEGLMIGDYISVKKRGMPIKVAAVHHKKVAYHAVVNKLEWVRESLLDPTPLTSEILKKNGFKKCAGNEWSVFKYEDDDYTKKALYQVLWSSDELYLEIASYTSRTGEFNRFGVEFVHELQHALRLCGIEKEIIL